MSTERNCEGCGQGMHLYREGARTCSPRCRQRVARAAKRAKTNRILPETMTNERRFVRYHRSKRPVTASGAPASSTDPNTWTTYTEAVQANVGAGIGYVLGNGVGCIDLDHCIVDGALLPWAQEIVDANQNTYIETSMSGDGLHIFGLLAEAPGRKIRDGRNIEIYSQGRYIALTRNPYNGTPAELSPLQLPA